MILPENRINPSLTIQNEWVREGFLLWKILCRYWRRRRMLSARMRDLERNGLRSTLGPQR